MDPAVETAARDAAATRRPPKYRVVMLNDDSTPFDFVIAILRDIFGYGFESAAAMVAEIHEKGAGVVGVYSFEIAETKVAQTHQRARSQGFELTCALEPEEEPR